MSSEIFGVVNVGAISGHDAPVFYRSDDFYNRWPVATAITRVIRSSPLAWSTRIGVFGSWGDGKTSVLNFLAKQQEEDGNIVIRYSPWGASTEAEIWSGFSKALSHGLKRSRAKITQSGKAGYFLRRYAPWLSKAIGTAGKAANLKAPGISVGTDFAAQLIERHLRITRKDVEAMTEIIGDRRVIVFIDDLDRTDPAVVPKLLLALRDLLDFSRFVFVLAFDKKAITASLAEYNSAWEGKSESFLDKIIDFPFELPAPTRDQIRRLANDQFSKLCDFVPKKSVQAVSELLPANPRKLKLLGRVLAGSREEAARHESGEINWQIVMLFALIRLESNELAIDLLNMSIDMESDEAKWLHWAVMSSREDREQSETDGLRRLVDKHSLKHCEERVKALVNAWRENISSLPGEGLRYQAMFTMTPHCITWGEFRLFFKTWRDGKETAKINSFVAEREADSQQDAFYVAKEFADALLGHYATVLDRASNVESGEAHLALMNEALDSLDLAHRVFVQREGVELRAEHLLPIWDGLHHIVMQWLHFNANPHEPELRRKEQELLVALAQALSMPMEIYERVKPWVEQEGFWGKREAKLKAELSRALQDAVSDGAVQVVLGLVRTPGQLKQLRSPENIGARYLLTDPRSLLFTTEHKGELLEALRKRQNSDQVVEDSVDYLAATLAAIPHGDQFCSAEERIKFVNSHQDFIKLLWGLCVSRPSQFRALQALRERRKTLVDAGVQESELDSPDWLDSTRTGRKGAEVTKQG